LLADLFLPEREREHRQDPFGLSHQTEGDTRDNPLLLGARSRPLGEGDAHHMASKGCVQGGHKSVQTALLAIGGDGGGHPHPSNRLAWRKLVGAQSSVAREGQGSPIAHSLNISAC
jgi:hypothetical protein